MMKWIWCRLLLTTIRTMYTQQCLRGSDYNGSLACMGMDNGSGLHVITECQALKMFHQFQFDFACLQCIVYFHVSLMYLVAHLLVQLYQYETCITELRCKCKESVNLQDLSLTIISCCVEVHIAFFVLSTHFRSLHNLSHSN